MQLEENDDDKKEEFNREFAEILERRNQLEPWQVATFNESSSVGFNFLMLASKYNNVEAVQFLISCRSRLSIEDDNGLTASDYAWKNKSLECLIELLNADAPFPTDFDVESLPPSKEKLAIIDIADKLRGFHSSITSGNLSEVESFVSQNPKVRFAYNEGNQCAMLTALECKRIKIYSFLRNKFFETGIESEVHCGQLRPLPDRVKKQLRDQFRKHLGKPVEDHVAALLLKSRDRSGNSKNFKKLIDFYEALDDIPLIRPILQLVANSEDTKIVFDFNEEGVFCMDPTAEEEPLGLTYHSEGYILIGAGRSETEVLATIAQELTHWAMQLVYKNHCRPFYAINDNCQREKYEKLVEKYKANKNLTERCPDIAEVFDSNLYDPAEIDKELVARVPHLLALNVNSKDKQDELSRTFGDLFEYFANFVLKDVEREYRLMNQRKEIREANNNFGVLKKSLDSDMLSVKCEKAFYISRSLFIKTSLPGLALEFIVKKMKENRSKDMDAVHIFIEVKQIYDAKNLETLLKVAESEVKPTFIIMNFKNNFKNGTIEENVRKSLQKLNVIYISATQSTCFQELLESEIEIGFDWNDLNDHTKLKVKESTLIFQNFEMNFNEIVTNDAQLMQLPLEMILKASTIALKSFHENLPSAPRVFIQRIYEFEEIPKNLYGSDDLCEMLLKHKTILIADSAGMGKSTSAAQLAKDFKLKNRLFWVVFLDLKQNTEAFLRDDEPQAESIDTNFFSAKLLKLESTFENRFFDIFFANKKVTFVIDGFDEISPRYKTFVIKILKAVQASQNQLLVTTRKYFAEELKSELKPKVFKIKPFTRNDQIKFLTESWSHKVNASIVEPSSDDDECYLEASSDDEYAPNTIIKKLMHKLSYSDDFFNFYYVPLHIFMLADVYHNQVLNIDDVESNMFSLYKKFVTKKIEVWNDKGPLAKGDNSILQQTTPATNLQQIFQRLALDQLFDAKEVETLNFPEIPEDIIDDMIARVGIVAYGPGGIVQFTHQTYAEFFVVDTIINSAFRKRPQIPYLSLFVKVIGGRGFGKVRKFMNDKLEISENKLETSTLAKYIEEIVMQNGESFTLYQLIIEERFSCRKIRQLVLETFDFNHKVTVKILEKVLQVNGYEFDNFKIVWSCIETFVNRNYIEAVKKDLLFTKAVDGSMIFAAMRFEKSFKISDEKKVSRLLLQISIDMLNEDEFLMFLYCEQEKFFPFSQVIMFNDGFFEEIWEAAKNKLGKDNLKKLVLGANGIGDTILHSFHPYPNKLVKWLGIIKELLEADELNEHLTAKGHWGLFTYNLFTYPRLKMETAMALWKIIDDNASSATQRKLFLEENDEGQIFLEKSIINDDKSVVDFFFKITETMLRKEKWKNLIDFLRKRGSLAEIILNMVVSSVGFYEKYSSKLTAAEFRSLLLCRTSYGENVLHFLVSTENNLEAELLWERIVEIINDSHEVKRLLFGTSSCNFRHVFNAAAYHNNDFLIKILEWCRSNFHNHDDLMNIFLGQTDHWTLLHILAEHGDENLTQYCINFFLDNFQKREERRQILSLELKTSATPIQTTFKNENQLVVDIFDAVYLEVFEAEELKAIISRKENNDLFLPFTLDFIKNEDERYRKWKLIRLQKINANRNMIL